MTFKRFGSGKYSVVENSNITISRRMFYTSYFSSCNEIRMSSVMNRNNEWLVTVDKYTIGRFETLTMAKRFVEKLNGSTEEIIGRWFMNGMQITFYVN